jgi:hypothetical protein
VFVALSTDMSDGSDEEDAILPCFSDDSDAGITVMSYLYNVKLID